MKRFRIVALLLAFLVAAPSLLHAHIIKGELFAGGNLCQVDGDECYGFKKLGLNAGAGALIPFTSWIYNTADKSYTVNFSRKYSLMPQFRVYDTDGKMGVTTDNKEVTLN